VTNHNSTVRWSGWGILNQQLAIAHILESATEQDLEQAVLREPGLYRTECTHALTLQSGLGALDALVDLMIQGQPAGVVVQRIRSPGVWIAGDSTIDPKATLNPPVYIGHQVRIDAGAVVGPGVIIEEGSIIEAGAFIRNCWILPRTYVGHQTTLINAIVSGNSLLSLDRNVLIKVSDPFLLDGDIQTRTATIGPGHVERFMAIVLWLITTPLVFWWRRRLRLKLKPADGCEHSVAFPNRMRYGFEIQPTALKPTMHLVRDRLPHALIIHFFKTFYPGLKDIWQGRVKFIGLEPRSLEEALKLSHTEQLRYAHWPIGLINASMLMDHDRKETRTLQGMPLHRSVQLVLAYGQRVRRSVAQAVTSQDAFALPNDTEPQFTHVSRRERLMKLSQIKPGITVVLITEESLDIHNVKTFRAEIKPIIEQNHAILLDMHRLLFIDSAGLSVLLECLRITTKKHTTFRLFGMSQTVQALFELVRMNRVFKIYATDVQALENLPQS
jgi:anti-sigma B factor antagonist